MIKLIKCKKHVSFDGDFGCPICWLEEKDKLEADYKRMTDDNLQLRLKNKRMREAIEYLLNTSGPMTSQQKECWPALEQTLKDKNVSDT